MKPLSDAACKALNHLVKQEAWAHDLLRRHEGKLICLDLPIGKMHFLIQGGYFAKDDTTNTAGEEIGAEQNVIVQPSVSFQVSQEAIWAFLSNGKTGALKHVKIAGDVDFASDLNQLANNLHWELEEDLSKLFGDAIANKLTQESKMMFVQGQSAIADLQKGVRDYLVNEKNALVGSHDLDRLKSELRTLRDDVERTEKRIERLLQKMASPKALS